VPCGLSPETAVSRGLATEEDNGSGRLTRRWARPSSSRGGLMSICTPMESRRRSLWRATFTPLPLLRSTVSATLQAGSQHKGGTIVAASLPGGGSTRGAGPRREVTCSAQVEEAGLLFKLLHRSTELCLCLGA